MAKTMTLDVPYYVQDGEGRWWKECPNDLTGETEYEPAPPAQAYQLMPNGKHVAQKDVARGAVSTKLAEGDVEGAGGSHERYFNELASEKPEDVRQNFRRLKGLRRRLGALETDVMLNRVKPGAAPNIMYVDDSEFEGMRAEWMAAEKEGKGKECRFQPLSSYAHKLTTSSGKKVRDIFAGEVGMATIKGQAMFVLLKQGYGTGNLVQVPEQIGNGPRDLSGEEVEEYSDEPDEDVVDGEIG